MCVWVSSQYACAMCINAYNFGEVYKPFYCAKCDKQSEKKNSCTYQLCFDWENPYHEPDKPPIR